MKNTIAVSEELRKRLEEWAAVSNEHSAIYRPEAGLPQTDWTQYEWETLVFVALGSDIFCMRNSMRERTADLAKVEKPRPVEGAGAR